MDKYQNKYRIQSARLQGYDYTREGLYFITICTHNREHYFGEIIDHKMILSNIGVMADVFWHEIKNHSKNVELHQFVVMPNHIHGILEIVDGVIYGDGGDVETMHASSLQLQSSNVSQKIDASSQQPSKNRQMQKISPKSGSVSRIIGAYKSAVTKHAHRLKYEFKWQTRFYDHIIKNNDEYQNIKNYIIKNPENWVDDKFYKDIQ